MATENWKKDNQEKMREYRRKYYANNKNSEKERISKRTKELRQFLKDLKSNLSCVKCSQNHPATLQFHHIDPNIKTEEISQMAKYGYSKERILEEIRKCEVLCANCHAILHYEERNTGIV
jgi:phosphopantetheine adenylyltransferase